MSILLIGTLNNKAAFSSCLMSIFSVKKLKKKMADNSNNEEGKTDLFPKHLKI